MSVKPAHGQRFKSLPFAAKFVVVVGFIFMARGITGEGQRVFGQWVERARLSSDTRQRVVEWLAETSPYESVGEFVSQQLFARFIFQTTGFPMTDTRLGRIERADGKKGAQLTDLSAFVEAKVLKLRDRAGELKNATLEDCVAVLCGELNPFNNCASSETLTN